jgi:hypothetical protein
MLKRYEFALGFAAATAIWALVFVWQSSLLPNSQTIESASNQRPQDETKNASQSERADERIARYNFWLAIFTAALVVVSSIQFIFLYRTDKTARIAADAAKRSADAAVLSQRPWISFEADLAGRGIVYRENGAVSVDFRVDLKVSGNSPATDVTVVCRWFAERNPFHVQEVLLRRLAEFAPQDQRSGFAPVIFPDDPIRTTTETAAAALADLQIIELPDERATLASKILIAVFYRFAFSDERHKTAKLYTLSATRSSHPGAAFVVFVAEGNLGTDRLRLDTLGHYAD